MNNLKADEFSALELSLPSMLKNYRYFRSRIAPGTKLLVLVKANAYGHGAVQMASMLQSAGANYLAVAYPIEGMELRSAGISLPIIVLTCGNDFFNEIIDSRLEPSLPNIESVRIFADILKKRNIKDYPVHIKIDSGMHRLGFMSDEIDSLTDFLKDCPEIKVRSMFSHLAVSEDPSEDEYTLHQINLFKSNADKITSRLGYKPMYHILNSAGIERFPQYQFDMVRLGIGIYGISALPGVRLSPVASLKCKVLQVKRLRPEDGTIGYGRYGAIAPEGTVTATIPVGYADGIDRRLGRGNASFEVGGHRAKTIGNICMDMCMLDVTGLDVKVGDTVTIFGENPTVKELADKLGTIPYEILTSVPRRIDRIVVRK